MDVILFVTAISKYLDSVTFSKDLLAVFLLYYIFVCITAMISIYLFFSVLASSPVSLLVSNTASAFFFVIFMFLPIAQHHHKPETDVSHSVLIPRDCLEHP
jgi:hypothetical protein